MRTDNKNYHENLSKNYKPIKEEIMETEIYAVMLLGKSTPSQTYANYDLAEAEARRLVSKERLTAYVLKAVSKIELAELKITMLPK